MYYALSVHNGILSALTIEMMNEWTINSFVAYEYLTVINSVNTYIFIDIGLLFECILLQILYKDSEHVDSAAAAETDAVTNTDDGGWSYYICLSMWKNVLIVRICIEFLYF